MGTQFGLDAEALRDMFDSLDIHKNGKIYAEDLIRVLESYIDHDVIHIL
jgi:Ca2+-binding EF-hand superfamily protein